ncbi:MAG: exodeoxyribonuclease III [Gammaproteobacteria bacterium]
MLKVATWNVNSVRIRTEQILPWLARERPDVLALQETKVPDAEFPADVFLAAGYHSLYAGQKSYNGVAILSRGPGTNLVTEVPGLNDPQRRILVGVFDKITLVNVYVPNGSEVGSEKYAYKLEWLQQFTLYAASLLGGENDVIILGDFNIAPEDRDVYDPAAWEGNVLVSPQERDRLQRLSALGLTDVFRLFRQDAGFYSWWDYRAGSYRRNHGLRIDLILASGSLASRCIDCRIDKESRGQPKPSDHAPVIAEFR